ncbi:MAG: PQQ-binding-like beta-propeller repeat protein [Planctomycetota bacterium]|jgi:outer membrane protein assembly factor BamB
MLHALLTGLALAAPPTASLVQEADPDQAAREAAFARLLTGARLEGYTTLTDGDGNLMGTELEADSYDLAKVEKGEDGKWRFTALINYGGRPIPISVSLPVEWAGGTPVIDVEDMKVPFMGTYSARVLFDGDRYVGVWRGDGYGGHILGKVVRAEPEEPTTTIHWPQFRGRQAGGLAEGYELPSSFDLESGENVRYRIPVPGLAHSSPVIHGDKLFLTTAVRADGEQDLKVGLYGDIQPVEDDSEFGFEVLCYEKSTGELLWRREAWRGVPAVKRHLKGSHAQPTPACDAERVVAFFGSEGLHAFDHDGNKLWERDLGVLDAGFFRDRGAQWGFGSSPVLHGGKVVVQCDVQDQSFVAVLDAATGETVWRVDREEESGWSTPTVHVSGERSQVICNGWKAIAGYDLRTGEVLWTAEPGGDIPVPTPVVSDGVAFITNAHGRYQPIYAIDLDATGHVSLEEGQDEFMVWGIKKRGNYMQTPIVYGDAAFFCRDNGMLSCYDAMGGERLFAERLDEGRSGYTASPVGGDGKLYITSEEGSVITVRAGRTFEVLARSSLGEEFMSTPAISEGTIYFRSRGHLTAVGL